MENSQSVNLKETLSRLSSKAGVTAALVLDRSQCTILLSEGTFASFRAIGGANADNSTLATPSASAANQENGQKDDGSQELAGFVWNYIKATDGLVHGLDSEDELKLLRLRTKKHELVIVPDLKYIFVVVHETS